MSPTVPSRAPASPSPQSSPQSSPSIALRGLCLRFGGETLFENLDLDLEAGRLTVLLGASGVGKTTLLRIVAGLEAPGGAGASVRAGDGMPLSGRIALMAQQDLLCPWLDAAANVALGARVRGQRPDRGRVAAMLDQVGLGGRGDVRPAALSGGMRQRVALARTLYEDRPVVLMDEPFSALDSPTRLRIQDLAAASLAGRTVLLITHDALEACRLADRLLVLAGRPARLHEHPVPPGPTPRPSDDAQVLGTQGALLRRLAAGIG